MAKKTTDSKKKPFLVQIREAIKNLDATSKAIRKSEFKIADFQSPIDNPAERIKREYTVEMDRQFEELLKQTREYNLRLFDKFIECSQALSRIPDLAIDATKVRTDDTRIPSFNEVYTHCFQVRGKVPVEVVLRFTTKAKLYQMPSDRPKITLHACVGDCDKYPVWTDFFLEYGPSSSVKKLPEQYEAAMQKALTKLAKLEAEQKALVKLGKPDTKSNKQKQGTAND